MQHAPYDGMVLVSLSWYLDQQIKATEGKWKVNIDYYFIFYIHLNSSWWFNLNVYVNSPHNDVYAFEGIRGSQSRAPS